jgi:hypothetical protein
MKIINGTTFSLDYKRISKIVQVGCGGTGGYIQYFLSRLIYSIPESQKPQYILCDGDIIEENNLCRQNFTESDIGQNKAEKLAVRYGSIYDFPIHYIDNYIEDLDTLFELLSDCGYGIPVLVGAVDNNASRQLFHEAFCNDDLKNIIYIDCGNDETSGQVACGIKSNGQILLPPLAEVYPDVLTDRDSIFKSQESCGEMVVNEPQNIATNILAGQIAFGYINNLITRKCLKTYLTTFNSEAQVVRSRYIEDMYLNNIKKVDL